MDKIVESDNRGNKIMGSYPTLVNSSVDFVGENNILFCETNVKLDGSILRFKGNNSLIYLGANDNYYKLGISIYNNSVFHMGRNNYINQKISVILSEHKHCFIGDYCNFSTNIHIRNADAHPIYDCDTMHRINESHSVYIGDHVWIGQFAYILKGTQIDSGSIVGAMSVLAGKRIGHNSVWGGNPAKLLKNNIFWDRACVHDWDEEQTNKSIEYSDFISKNEGAYQNDYWIYGYSKSDVIAWEQLESILSGDVDCLEKCKKLFEINNCQRRKNRFVHIL